MLTLNTRKKTICNRCLPVLSSLLLSKVLSSQSATQVQHQQSSVFCDYDSLLKSCIYRKLIGPGKQIHARLCVSGYGFNFVTCKKLINLYCVCGSLIDARQMFDRIPKRDIFLWNVLIRAYAWNGPYDIAISLYYQMIEHGLAADKFTFPFVLKACSALAAIKPGREIHEHIRRSGLENNIFVGAALIDMYAKCGLVDSARDVFDKMQERDVVLWNSMVAAYLYNGRPEESLSLCREMCSFNIRPSEGTVVTTISTSADMAALPHGRQLHAVSWRLGFCSDKVNTALLDMYAKCGSVRSARNMLRIIKVRTIVAWNTMINGYAMLGFADEALDLFDQMRKGQILPDHITFVGVLSACSRGGLLDEGWKFFNSMRTDHGIEPTVQHYTCMVDLLGRCGKLDEAHDFILKMKVGPDSGVWGALLNACKIRGNADLAEVAMEKLIALEPLDASNYVILSNLYAQAGKWDKVTNLRSLMINGGIKKTVGYSSIEVKNNVHAFISGDTSHVDNDKIYEELKRVEGLIREVGYSPNTESVFHDVEDDEKDDLVGSHSERLAICYGLISTSPGTRMLITKNLRVCEDCHVAIKLISRVTKREITVRDVNRYHHFKDGSCSCGDYW